MSNALKKIERTLKNKIKALKQIITQKIKPSDFTSPLRILEMRFALRSPLFRALHGRSSPI
jgi:hypothetical protein